MKINTIINGDTFIEIKNIEDESIDLIFADPPYWMRVEGELYRNSGTVYDGCDDEWDQFNSLEDYETFTYNWLKECYRVLKPNGSIWVIGSMQCIYTIGSIMHKIGYWFLNDVIWHKKNPTPNFKGTRLNNSHETLIWATKNKKSKYTFHYKTAKEMNTDTVSYDEYAHGIRKQMGSVWRFSVCSGTERLKDNNGNKIHSTQKPIDMLERIITISSNINDIVLDPFGGTMTTAAAAKKLGRNYVTIEKNKTYCEYGKKRLESVEFSPSPFAYAEYDIKPIKVSIEEMISNKYFTNGEYFYLKNGSPIARLCSNGKLNYDGIILDIHTCAAKAKKVKAERLNGFNVWYVKRNDDLISISTIREQYRKTLHSNI